MAKNSVLSQGHLKSRLVRSEILTYTPLTHPCDPGIKQSWKAKRRLLKTPPPNVFSRFNMGRELLCKILIKLHTGQKLWGIIKYKEKCLGIYLEETGNEFHNLGKVTSMFNIDRPAINKTEWQHMRLCNLKQINQNLNSNSATCQLRKLSMVFKLQFIFRKMGIMVIPASLGYDQDQFQGAEYSSLCNVNAIYQQQQDELNLYILRFVGKLNEICIQISFEPKTTAMVFEMDFLYFSNVCLLYLDLKNTVLGKQ